MTKTPDDAVNAMRNNGREPIGKDAYSFTAPSPSSGIATPRKNTQAGEVPGAGTATHRGQVMGQVRGIKMTRPAQPVENANTQANGRIIPPSHRGGKNFWSQAVTETSTPAKADTSGCWTPPTKP